MFKFLFKKTKDEQKRSKALHTELIHFSPTLLTNHRRAIGGGGHLGKAAPPLLGASATADIYALGCIANQIYFREPLYQDANEDENFNDTGAATHVPRVLVFMRQFFQKPVFSRENHHYQILGAKNRQKT